MSGRFRERQADMEILTKDVFCGSRRVRIITIAGKCKEEAHAKQIEEAFDEAEEEGILHIAIEGGEMHNVCSSVIGRLVKLLHRLQTKGGKMCLIRPNYRFLEELEVFKLASYFNIYEKEEEAVASCALVR